MNFDFLSNIPWFGAKASENAGPNFGSTTIVIKQPRQGFDIRHLGWPWSVLSVVNWGKRGSDEVHAPPTTINRRLKRNATGTRRPVAQGGTEAARLRFRPYVSKVPWHTGLRGLLSQLFPRYGHYCGPNWSSGKNGGSPVWDQRPIDWLDYCCYCHDIGYDTHDQAKLLEADLAFLECLERPSYPTKGDAHVAHMYKTMCVTGLRNVLIPYRTQLLRLNSRQPLIDFGWLSNAPWKGWSAQKS